MGSWWRCTASSSSGGGWGSDGGGPWEGESRAGGGRRVRVGAELRLARERILRAAGLVGSDILALPIRVGHDDPSFVSPRRNPTAG